MLDMFIPPCVIVRLFVEIMDVVICQDIQFDNQQCWVFKTINNLFTKEKMFLEFAYFYLFRQAQFITYLYETWHTSVSC